MIIINITSLNVIGIYSVNKEIIIIKNGFLFSLYLRLILSVEIQLFKLKKMVDYWKI